MKIRYGLVLAIALLIGPTGCASGGGGGSTGATGGTGGAGTAVLGGERPRTTQNTRDAESSLEAGDEAAETDPAQARTHYQAAYTSAQAAIAEDETNPLAHRLAALAA